MSSRMANDSGGLLGAILGGVNTASNLYDAYQNRKTSKRNVDKTIAAQKAEAELAYQRSIEQRDFMNQYNSPQAQMQRFIDAGLNPHLIYGSGGSPGNQASPISYQAADLQYRYAAPKYGEAVGSFLPTLMAVGSWLQDMRATEAGIRKTEMETVKTDTVVDQMLKMNPELLKRIQGQIELLPGQKAMQDVQRDRGIQVLRDLETEFRQKYGDDLWKTYGSNFKTIGGKGAEDIPIGGTRALQFLQEKQKLLQAESTTKLKEAQASWADFDITNPQQIMLMVLNGVLSMAGGAVKLSAGKAKPSGNQYRAKERPRGLSKRRMGPNHPDRK